jgi:hypothetical protein
MIGHRHCNGCPFVNFLWRPSESPIGRIAPIALILPLIDIPMAAALNFPEWLAGCVMIMAWCCNSGNSTYRLILVADKES